MLGPPRKHNKFYSTSQDLLGSQTNTVKDTDNGQDTISTEKETLEVSQGLQMKPQIRPLWAPNCSWHQVG